MHESKKISLLVLVATALACSGTLFSFLNDPEGPNLLVVTGMATVVYFLSLAAYLLSLSRLVKFVCALLIQIVLAVVFFFALK